MAIAVKYEMQLRPVVEVVENIVELDEYGDATLEQMRNIIKADTLEVVWVRDDLCIWVDESGFLKPITPVFNVRHKEWEREMNLAGICLILCVDEDGNTVGLNKEQLKWIKHNLEFTFAGMLHN